MFVFVCRNRGRAFVHWSNDLRTVQSIYLGVLQTRLHGNAHTCVFLLVESCIMQNKKNHSWLVVSRLFETSARALRSVDIADVSRSLHDESLFACLFCFFFFYSIF
jgi:hypothetical protein